jgi:meso-butanediol dehydrogenase/(S,S)-butanediol dehydrogenase/diacetyl reductase
MSDKTAIITGAANGIGAALAKRLARRNINLTLVDQDVVNLRKLPIELGLDDSNSLIVVADVSREQDVEAYVRQTLDKFGRIDYFANNAGIEGEVCPY